MKKTLFTLLLASAVMLGFSNCKARSGKTANDSPVETVSENGGSTVKLTKEVFLEKIWDYENSPKVWKYKGDKPAVIDFYADWCGPCRKASPILEEVAEEYKDKVTVYKIDTQVERELASVFGIRGIPAFLYIPMSGEPTMTSGIARTTADTKKMFTDNINKLLLTDN